ncbi:MAG: nucleoside deaminase [Chloroflexota bacterium]
MNEHVKFLRLCIQLAAQAKAMGNHPFGSLLVHDGEILLQAQNGVVTYNDLGHHPESILARSAAGLYDADFLADCTLYTSTEPCAMCSGAIYWSGIGRVVFACSVETMASFTENSLRLSCRDVFARGTREIVVVGPLIEDEARQVHEGFW